jgi:hypothetical protein
MVRYCSPIAYSKTIKKALFKGLLWLGFPWVKGNALLFTEGLLFLRDDFLNFFDTGF